MTIHSRQSGRRSVTFDHRVDDVSAPVRLVLATCSTSRLWWLALFVAVPVGALAGSLWISPQVANGIVGLCGFLSLVLWWTGVHLYTDSRLVIDGTSRTLTAEYGSGQKRTVDLERVESVSVQTIGSLALVRIDSHTLSFLDRFLLSDPFLVPADRLPATFDALCAAGVAVPETGPSEYGRSWRSIETGVRPVTTALALGGVPLYAFSTFGTSVLVTNGAGVVLLLGLAAIVHELSNW